MKYLLNEADAQEQEQVSRWLVADEANLAYYNQLKKIWHDSRQLASTIAADENEAWRKFQQRIHPPVRRVSFGWIAVAASVIIMLAIGLVAYWALGDRVREVTVLAHQTVLNDTLPDGSTVIVNKGSSISYPSKFKGRTREVNLKGEAFFNVTPNREKPFTISVNDVKITVVGTSFNVKSIKGNTEVVVETGIVRVTRAGKTVDLRPREKILIDARDSVLVKESVSDQLYNYYRTKEFVCDDTPLWKVVEVINEAYNSHVVIRNPALKDMRLNTTFHNESLEQVLNVISITFDIKARNEGDTISLQ